VLKQIAPHLAVIHAQNESLAHFDAGARQTCWMRLPESI